MRFFLFLLFLSSSVLAQEHSWPGSQDHYKNFSELASRNKEGEDYRIEVENRGSPILVMAFHGGLIEPGTTELARAIAQGMFNFYGFASLKDEETDEISFTSSLLHLTSARFDEPRLMELVSTENFCLSIHGFGGEEADFCVGGGNPEQRKALSLALSHAFPEYKSCELCCNPFNGVSLKNPPNRCKQQGVQVEMSPRVRRRILNDKDFLRSLSDHFRNYLNTEFI